MALFRVLTDIAPSFFVQCSNCKHKFWVDAVTEENLILVSTIKNGKLNKELVEKCPNCKETREVTKNGLSHRV